MLRVHVYPFMDGLEVWVAYQCAQTSEAHREHRRGHSGVYVSAEDIDRHGVADAVAEGILAAMREHGDLVARARC